MKLIPFVSFSLLSLSLYGAIGSSVIIPTQQHLKYSFVNHRNHLVQKTEQSQYYKSLAPMKEEEIRTHLSQEGYSVRGIKLSDIASELVYQVFVTDSTAKNFKLLVDPSTGSVLSAETIQ